VDQGSSGPNNIKRLRALVSVVIVDGSWCRKSEGRGISFAPQSRFVLVDVIGFSSVATALFLVVIAVLWDQFRSKAHPPLNLSSDVLGQAPLWG
jgi:hypothetical protein